MSEKKEPLGFEKLLEDMANMEHKGLLIEARYSAWTSRRGFVTWVLIIPGLWLSLGYLFSQVLSSDIPLFLAVFPLLYLIEVLRIEPWGIVLIKPDWVRKIATKEEGTE